MPAYRKELIEIPMDQLIVSDFNVRKDLEAGTEDAGLQDLINSIQEKGLLNPITVRKKERFIEVIAGQRRYIACKSLGWVSMSAFMLENVSDMDVQIISLVENVQRADLHPLDKGRAYQTLYDFFGTYTKVAKEVGISNSTVKRYIKLLSLSPDIQQLLTTSDGPAGVCTLSVLAEYFPVFDEQEYVLMLIGQFKQQVQEKIIRISEGDITKIEQLVEQALLGCFSVEICHGIDECPYIPDRFKIEIKQFLESEKKENYVDELPHKEVDVC